MDQAGSGVRKVCYRGRKMVAQLSHPAVSSLVFIAFLPGQVVTYDCFRSPGRQ